MTTPPSHSALALTGYASVFSPLDTTNRAEAVAHRLGDAIALRVLPDGAPLPPESELAGRLGVATTTVREALSLLRADDLVVTRRGRRGGSFVQAPPGGARSALMRRLRELGQGDLRDLSDHYAAISGACAALAARRADEDEIQRLERGAGRVVAVDGPGPWVRAEGDFHLDVATAAQSARLTRAELDLHGDVGFLLWLGHDAVSAASAARSHHDLVRAIGDRDADRARTIAEDHISDLLVALRPLHREALGGRS